MNTWNPNVVNSPPVTIISVFMYQYVVLICLAKTFVLLQIIDFFCYSFNPTDPNLIVGGCINGQIILWNIEQYQDHLQINKATESSESRTMLANTVSKVLHSSSTTNYLYCTDDNRNPWAIY